MSEGVSFVQYQENNAKFYPFDGQEPEDLKLGYPLYPGDRLVSERNSFLEIVLSDGNLLWLGSSTDLELRAISLTEGYPDKRTYLFLNYGEISLEVLNTVRYEEEPVLGFPEGDFYILTQGLYFLSKDLRGNSKIMIIEGKGEVATSQGSVFIRSGEEVIVFGDGYVDRRRLSLKNEFFAQMVENRRSMRIRSQSGQYTGRQFYSSHYVLDGYGSWIYEPEFSMYVWRPTVVVGWTPYYNGYWRWTPHGWFWVSYEPWGYITYHYGRWVWTPQYGWVWVPGYTWAPAWVYWFWIDFYVGWCPMGYYDYWWYYRWDWWWNWPPCWYNDCYFGFKGRVNLKHLQRDFWIFADGRTLGKTNMVFHKDLKIDPKSDGLLYAMNLPVDNKNLLKLDEHFVAEKNIIKNDLTPVFKLKEKPTQEAKNLLSSFKETHSRDKNALKIDSGNLKREKVYQDLKPGRSINLQPKPQISPEGGDLRPKVINRDKLPSEKGLIERKKDFSRDKEVSPKDKSSPPANRDNKSLEPKKDTGNVYPEPKKDIQRPENEVKPIQKDSSNFYRREPVNNYGRGETIENKPAYERSYETPSYKRENRSYEYQDYERTPVNTSPSYNSRTYQTPSSDRTPVYTPPTSPSPNFNSPRSERSFSPSQAPSYSQPSRPPSSSSSGSSSSSPSSSSHSSSSSSSSHSSSSSPSHSGSIKTR